MKFLRGSNNQILATIEDVSEEYVFVCSESCDEHGNPLMMNRYKVDEVEVVKGSILESALYLVPEAIRIGNSDNYILNYGY